MWIPKSFLSRIIAELSKVKIVGTFPGPNGGVQLLRDPREINIRLIWEAMDKPLVISDCLEHPEACPLNVGCPVNARWAHIQTIILQEMERVTIAELASEARRLDTLKMIVG